MIHGPDISVAQLAAKDVVMRHFVGIAEADGTPPTLRAMYVLKTAEARNVLAGGTSDYISQEAALRNITAQQMAQVIENFARQSEALELARMTANVAIEAATDASQIQAVLTPLGLTISIDTPL